MKLLRYVMLLISILFCSVFGIDIYNYTSTPGASYLGPDDANDLSNGVMSNDYYSSDWVTFYTPGATQQIVFDLSSSTEIGSVDVHYLNVAVWSQMPPLSIEFTFSDDGTAFSNPVVFNDFDASEGAHTVNISLANNLGRYVRAIITPASNGWHKFGEFKFNEPGVVSYTTNPSPNYTEPDTTGSELYDDHFPTDMFDSGWVNFFCPDQAFEVNFNFNNTISLSEVGLNYMAYSSWSLSAPLKAVFTFSSDGVVYGNPVVINDFDNSEYSHNVFADAIGIKCRYAKIKITTGSSGWLRIGEIAFKQRGIVSYESTLQASSLAPDDGTKLTDGVIPADVFADTWVKYNPGANGEFSIIFNFNEVVDFAAVGLVFADVDVWNQQGPEQMTISFSNDGINFVNPVTFTDFTRGDGIFTDYIDVLGNSCKYIKADITADQGGWLQFGEFIFKSMGEISYTSSVAPVWYASDDGTKLSDGFFPADWYSSNWVEYQPAEPNVTLLFDLAQFKDISSVGIYYLSYGGWNLNAPHSFEVEFSNDGQTFTDRAVIYGLDSSDGTHKAEIDTFGVNARFVKVNVAPGGAAVRLGEVYFNDAGSISYIASPESHYFAPDDGTKLTNGIIPDGNPYDGDWVKYNPGASGVITFDFNLNQTLELSSVGIRYICVDVWNQTGPAQMALSFSNDGVNYSDDIISSGFETADGPHTGYAEFQPQQARFVRVKVTVDAAGWIQLGEFIFVEAGEAAAPEIVCAGFKSYDDPYSVLLVFNQPVNASSLTLDNFIVEDKSAASIRLLSQQQNCAVLTLAERVNIGESVRIKYKGITNDSGDIVTKWRVTNYFVNHNVQSDAQSILYRQLPDGAYSMFLPSNGMSFQTGDNVWINPSFDLLAATALLYAYDIEGQQKYIDSVLSYLQWHAAHLNTDGTIYDYDQTYPDYVSKNDYDSTDAYAAQFIEVAYMYYERTSDGAFLDWVWPYIIKTAGAIDLTLDGTDGLAYAKPGNDQKLLMDNSDVYLGYKLAAQFAAMKSDSTRQQAWTAKAAASLAGIQSMYLSQEGRYAWAKSQSGQLSTHWSIVYPDGTSQMTLIRSVLAQTDKTRAAQLWQVTVDNFMPGGVPMEGAGAWWALGTMSAGKYNTLYDEIAYANFQKERTTSQFKNYMIMYYPNIFVIHQKITTGDAAKVDLNGDAVVSMNDYAVFADCWLSDTVWEKCDFNGDANLNVDDITIFANNWLASCDYLWWQY